jgi:hypothetical protein
VRWFLAGLAGALLAAAQSGASEYNCRHVAVVDMASGQTLSGIEDLVHHPESNTLILSVHDRWGDRDGHSDAKWGMYRVSIDALHSGKSRADGESAISGDTRSETMKPHGLAIRSLADGSSRLAVINHRFHQEKSGPEGQAGTTVEEFRITDGGLLEPLRSIGHPDLCPANDLDWIDDDRLLVSLDRENCGGFWRFLELSRAQWRGKLALVDLGGTGAPEILSAEHGFPNGVLVDGERIVVAFSREERVASYRLKDGELIQHSSVALQGGGDNLARAADGSYLLAVHPDLWDFGLYSLGVWGFDTAPTQLVRIGSNMSAAEVLFEHEDGEPLSGVTGIVQVGDLLIGGAAFDDGLAVCEPK